ncbi:MAG: sigma 54-interacting transcriptional regulator [Desulfobacterales bacterium]|nr:sigma 54-interacting transcriptional regulator [Desulfobacterales bacterium]
MKERLKNISGQDLITFFDNLLDFIIILDNEGNIIYTNPAVFLCLGYSFDELTAMHIIDLYPEDRKTEANDLLHDMLTKKHFIGDMPFVTKTGNLIPVETKITQSLWDGKLLPISISRDVTPRVKAESALTESERRLSTLMSNLPGLAYRCKNNHNWTMEVVSDGCLELTGYKPSDLINDNVIPYCDIVHPDDVERIRKDSQKTFGTKKPFELTFRIITKSGEVKWVWEQGIGVFSKTGKLVALEGFITDVTEQKMLELQLNRENKLLKYNIKNSYKFCDIVGRSDAMQQVFDIILQAANSDANVIIYGESGTGKELAARAIHKMGSRHTNRFVPVNCGAIPEHLIESEFFGYKKGAFTGANSDKPGYLDIAEGGTLFLDEIGEINLNLQVKLLRAIEGSGYTPVGSNEVKIPSVRIIAATNKSLKRLIKSGAMREDFFYRIHIIPLSLPPLRERKEDIPLLVYHFLKQETDKNINVNSQNIIDAIQNYDWPGNVRELQNVVQRYVTLNKIDFMDISSTETDDFQQIPENIDFNRFDEKPLQSFVDDVEKKVIQSLLEKHRWRRRDVSNILDINYRTLLRKIKKHGLSSPKL